MLFKILHGDKSRISTDITPYHEGYCYVTHDGDFYVDMNDERVKLNARDAETLLGASLNTILNSSDLEIPTSKAVLDAINEVDEKASVQPDWSVNDETNPAYVQNRTHWEEPPVDTLLVPEQTINFTLIEEDGFSMYIAEDPFQLDLVEGETYKIIWDGTEYICNGIITYDGFGYVDCGNMALFYEDGEDTGEPFFMRNMPPLLIGTTDSAASHTISVYKHAPVIHILDNKYLNSNVLTLDNYLKAGYTAGKTVESVRASDGVTVEGEIFNDYVYNKAPAASAHAEGSNTTASGTMSHAEGGGTVASGLRSHAQGFVTEAAGEDAHAEGDHTIANGKAQHVQGMYNIQDTYNNGDPSERGKYAHIVGNGTLSKRSNAHTIAWDGTAWFAKTVKVGGTNQDDAQELVTQAYVDALIAALRPKHATVSLPAAGWIGNASPYYQVVDIAGVTEYSQIDLKPSAEQLEFFRNKDIAFVTENEDGVVTVYVLGDKPSNDYTMQVLITEVTV